MYQFTLYDLSDVAFEAYKKSFEMHMIENIEKRIGPSLGLNISISFKMDSQFMSSLRKIWMIARGNREFCNKETSEKQIDKMYAEVEKMASIIEDAKLNGSLLPNLMVYQTLSRKYVFDSIIDYACVLAEIRLKAMRGEFLTITEAKMLGAFKVRESITREIYEGNIRSVVSQGNKYLVNGKDVMDLLVSRERWYWIDLSEKVNMQKALSE